MNKAREVTINIGGAEIKRPITAKGIGITREPVKVDPTIGFTDVYDCDLSVEFELKQEFKDIFRSVKGCDLLFTFGSFKFKSNSDSLLASGNSVKFNNEESKRLNKEYIEHVIGCRDDT